MGRFNGVVGDFSVGNWLCGWVVNFEECGEGKVKRKEGALTLLALSLFFVFLCFFYYVDATYICDVTRLC